MKKDLFFKNWTPKVYQPLPRPAGQSLPLEINEDKLALKYFSDEEELSLAPQSPIGNKYLEMFPDTFIEESDSPQKSLTEHNINSYEAQGNHIDTKALDQMIP